jgi:hypothetical protein
MNQRTVHFATLLVLLALARPAEASSVPTPGPPVQKLWIRDALTGAGIPRARARTVGPSERLTVEFWADPRGRLRVFPGVRTRKIEIVAPGYHAAWIVPAPLATGVTTVWLVPKQRPRALRPEVVAARRRPNTRLLHGFVVNGGTGAPLAGASVRLAGADAATVTNPQGYFLLYALALRQAGAQAAPESVDLVVSAPGYVSVRLAHVALVDEGSFAIIDLDRGSGETVRDMSRQEIRPLLSPAPATTQPSVGGPGESRRGG